MIKEVKNLKRRETIKMEFSLTLVISLLILVQYKERTLVLKDINNQKDQIVNEEKTKQLNRIHYLSKKKIIRLKNLLIIIQEDQSFLLFQVVW